MQDCIVMQWENAKIVNIIIKNKIKLLLVSQAELTSHYLCFDYFNLVLTILYRINILSYFFINMLESIRLGKYHFPFHIFNHSFSFSFINLIDLLFNFHWKNIFFIYTWNSLFCRFHINYKMSLAKGDHSLESLT